MNLRYLDNNLFNVNRVIALGCIQLINKFKKKYSTLNGTISILS